MTKPRLISGNLNEVFNTAISTIFVYQFNVYVHHFFYCVHSDHLGSRYELSALGTLQSSVSRQEEVQFKSTNQYILNFVTQGCFQKVRYHQLQLLAKKQISRKMYLALFVEILVFLTFLPGLFVAGPRSEEEFKKWSLELQVAV